MYRRSKLFVGIRSALLLSSSAVGFTSNATVAAEQKVEAVESIQVTGSRIKRTDIESSIPIAVINRSDILSMGALNVADALKSSPVVSAGTDQSNSSFDSELVGLNTIDLRGLGEERTLVLVNGRRFVSGVSPSVGYAVDLNAIPTSMIERIEILKSASSAIYGSDAVAGVINIITRENFEGLELNTQAGISSEKDREKYSINLTAGNSWKTGRATLAVGYDEDKGLKSSDREFSSLDEAILLNEQGEEYSGRVFSSYPPQGRVDDFNADGSEFSSDDFFNRASYRQLVTPIERKYVAMNLSQEIVKNVEYFAEVNWNSSKTNNSTVEPTPFSTEDVYLNDRGGTGGIAMTNPMVPQLLRDNLLALVDDEGNPLYTLDSNIPDLVRRMTEFGARSTDVERSTIRVVNGIDWNIDDNWQVNTYLSWGQTQQGQQDGGHVNLERAALAFDVEHNADTGELQCRNELARFRGCVPLDLFGENTASVEAVNYVRTPSKAEGKLEQFITSAVIPGQTPLVLSGGNAAVAFGFEHRLEKGAFLPGDFAQVGASSTNKSQATNGRFHTNDIYGELSLPVFANLNVDLAARYSDHSISGGDTTWNIGAQYSPIASLMLRASAATAVRTPNIADLYGGRGETFESVTDPCSGVSATDTDVVGVNCNSIDVVAERIASDPDGIFTLTQIEAQSTGGTTGGNERVQAETAQTLSAGFVWQVADGLSMTLDYYHIDIDDAIDMPARTTVLNRCYEVSHEQFDESCQGNAVRNHKGALIEVHSTTSNESNIETFGFDLDLLYSVNIGAGRFSANLLWNRINEYTITSIEQGIAEHYAGEVLKPENRANFNLAYVLDDWAFSWRMRYWGNSVDSLHGDNYNFTTWEPLQTFNHFDDVVYHDVSATYYINEHVETSVGISNLFDKQPPIANQSSKHGGPGINTVSEAYDVTGQYLQASITVRL